MKVHFYKHNIGLEETQSVRRVLKSLFLTTGPVTLKFESDFARYLGCKHAVGVSSWTMGGVITLSAFGIGAGDEVITTPLSFIATANIILQVGAKPVFVDVEPETGNMDANLIERAITPKTKAILPVHLYGQMCDMRRIRKIADQYGLIVIEDAAHCIEGMRDGVRPGELGHAAIFSFYATKTITCGEGGAIATNSKKLAEKLMLLRLHGMTKTALDRYFGKYQHWDMKLLGYKCNLSDIQAALLIPQLKRIHPSLRKRSEICKKYESSFALKDESASPPAKISGISFPKVLPNSRHARHLFTIWVDPKKRDQMLSALQKKGIGVAVNFSPIHLMTYYRKRFGVRRGTYPVAEKIGSSTITLPMYPKLSPREIEHVIAAVQSVASALL